MGICKYCGTSAGILKSAHTECEQFVNDVSVTIVKGLQYSDIKKKINTSKSTIDVCNNMLIAGWDKAVEQFLDDGILSNDEEARLNDFLSYYNLEKNDLEHSSANIEKLVKGLILRDVINGIIPKRVEVQNDFPINLQKGEQAVWCFNSTEYLEDRTRREYIGSSSGVSLRVAKGVYYRVGSFKGTPIDKTTRVSLDKGLFLVTDKNIYYSGQNKGFRIPYSKIVSFNPYSNGIGLMRDSSNAKPQIFVTGDGWFAYNLIVNLARL